MASSLSSSAIIHQAKHDVFLSFRGEDTRNNFLSHLYTSLCQKQIQTFIDDDGLKRGDEISPMLLKAIEESIISVVIFSKDYASSKWCLDELVKIIECRERNGQIVMPIFYNITPSDVRKQAGSFKDAFIKHEKQFKKIPEKVQRWRAALIKASNLSGWDSMVTKPESKLVDDIVRAILKKLNNISPSNDCEDLVGVDSRIDHIKSLLCLESLDFRILGIWGMSGIGKTTIAGVVFNQIRNKFESSCFIANVREESEKRGLVYLRNQLLSQLLEEENLTIGTPHIPNYIKRRLQCKKVFVVLDDVSNNVEQLGAFESLIRAIGGLGQGSRVIITTRDKQVLGNYGVHKYNMYEVKGLKENEALQLFYRYAFKQKSEPKDFSELSNKVVNYAKGNPLVLKVLGSLLYLKSVQDWKTVLYKLKSIPNLQIYNVLKISYHELDREEQNIFLDIACFFKGENNNYVIEILNSCYFAANDGLSTLMNKSLITRSAHNELEMHDALQEMGWEIVREESFKEPGKRSRLWNHDDVAHVLKNNTGTDSVEGLFLDMSKLNQSLHLSSQAFESMPNLKFLKFYVPCRHFGDFKVHIPQGLKYLSNELRYLHWHGYPLKTLPTNFTPKQLFVLELPYSNIDEQFLAEKKDVSDFKPIELYQSDAREREHCQSCLHINPSKVQYLSNLSKLNLSGCKSIRSFPSNIHFGSFITLDLSNCINLSKFPQISGNVRELCLTGTAIDEVPSSIACLSKLDTLFLWNCKRLKSVSSSTYKLESLARLGLWGQRISKSQLSSYIACWKDFKYLGLGYCNLKEIPDDLCCLSSLEQLNLRGNKFESLPKSIKQLSQLTELFLTNCNMLQSIPELPLALKYLDASDCCQLQSIADPLSNLEELSESELGIVSENFYSSQSSYMLFVFMNCQKLKYNSQQIIQHMSTLALRIQQIHSTKVFGEISLDSVILPGSEIPEWFSYQRLGSSISIEVPQHWCHDKLAGFALSAVLALEKGYGGGLIKIICMYDYGNSDEFEWSSFVRNPESDHIVLGYTPCIDLKGDYTTASFKFSLYDYTEGVETGLKVKSCGVRPLYEQPNISSEDLGETKLADREDLIKSHDANTSEIGNGNGTCNEVEVEPNANRYCSLRASCLLLFLFVFFGCWRLLMLRWNNRGNYNLNAACAFPT